MKVLLFSDYYFPGYKGGGPIKTTMNLISMTHGDLDYKIVTRDRDLGDKEPYECINIDRWNLLTNCSVFYLKPGIFGIIKIFLIILRENKSITYLNSFFSFRFSFAPLIISKVLRRKIILGTRGEFSKGALSLKFRKKKLFIKLFKIFNLYRGVVFQASSEYEANDIREVLGEKVDIFIAEDVGAQDFSDSLPVRSDNALNAVFVSRISPMKNLLLALEILRDVLHPLTYHIYGPIEDYDYWTKCEAIIKTLPSHINVQYKGELTPSVVVRTMSSYDVFFMPTKGENYCHVIAEALCAGLPILIADTTPWRALQENGVGWDLPLNDPLAFSTVLDQLAVMSSSDYRIMRENILIWSKNKFSQHTAAIDNIAMFRYTYQKK